ncbi:hypothetical protein CRG98_029823, partial [Punica granatum]
MVRSSLPSLNKSSSKTLAASTFSSSSASGGDEAGIDLKAGGKSKKTRRTAPKSDDIYLKLLVK